MPPRGVKSPKLKRQYEHIKESELARGVGTKRAKSIASATINKTRRKKGETKTAPRRSTAGKTARKKSSGTSSRGKSTSSRGKSSSSRGKSTSSRGKSSSSRSRSSSSRSRR